MANTVFKYIVDGCFPKQEFQTLGGAIEYAKSKDIGQPEIDIAVFKETYENGIITFSECVYSIYRELPHSWDD